MISNLAPFERFQGRRFIILSAVFVLYTAWFVLIGPFSKLQGLAEGIPLQEELFYSGTYAVGVFEPLNAQQKYALYKAYIFDVPYMILQALVFEAAIVFGLKTTHKANTKWALCLILPILFLLFDFLEDSFLALTLATRSVSFGTLAGIFTFLKFSVFIPAVCISIGWLVAGFISKVRKKPS